MHSSLKRSVNATVRLSLAFSVNKSNPMPAFLPITAPRSASVHGLIPAPAGHTLYAASKAYLIKFSQALALENRRFGVNVLAVCPGFTYSEFHDVTGTRGQMKGIPSWLWMAAQPVVRDALDAVDRGDIVRVSGRANRMIKRLFAWLPDRLALRLIDQRGKDFRATDGQAAPTPD